MKALNFLAHILFFSMSVGLLAGFLPCHFIISAISLSLLYFLLSMGLRATALAMPIHFPHLYLFWVLLVNILVVPAHFILWAFSAHLLLFTFFTLMGFLLNPLGFFGPITIYLPLITFQILSFFPWVYYFIPWVFSAHLLPLYLLLFL